MFTRRLVIALSAVSAAAVLAACSSPAPMMATTSVMLLEPANGATVSSPFKVRFGVKGMTVAPAGEVVANSGHHHLLINLDSVAKGQAIPFTPQHMHFGKGQTEADVTLPAGTYKLTAQFANGAHESYGAPMSQTITVTVK
jgi:hypothetical protein